MQVGKRLGAALLAAVLAGLPGSARADCTSDVECGADRVCGHGACEPRAPEGGESPRRYTPIDIALVAPVSPFTWMDPHKVVIGANLGILYSRARSVYGVNVSPVSRVWKTTGGINFTPIYGRLGDVYGVNVASVSRATGTVAGIDSSLFWFSARNMYGIKVGLLSSVDEDMYGIDTALFYSSARDSYGLHVGLIGSLSGSGIGVRTSALYDVADGAVRGVQISGFYNRAGKDYDLSGDFSGIQVTAGKNTVVGMKAYGIQIAGYKNESVADLAGIQIGGFINETDGFKMGACSSRGSESGGRRRCQWPPGGEHLQRCVG